VPLTEFEVTLPASTVSGLKGMREISLRQRPYEHDLLTIDVAGYLRQDLPVRTNDPITCSMQHLGKVINFTGHVHSIMPFDQNHSQDRRIVLHAMGPSYQMKNQRQRAWTKARVSDIALQIAGEYRFHAQVESHPQVFDLITQPGESDWALLVRLAKRIGFVFFVSGTTLVFRSRGLHLQERRRSAPTVTYRDSSAGSVVRSDILTFTPHLSENNVYDGVRKGQHSVSGIDPRTGQIVADHRTGASNTAYRPVNTSGQFTLVNTSMVVGSVQEAQTRNSGHDELARLQHRADAVVEGVSRLRQCDEIYIDGVSRDYAGYWTVLGVTHTIGYQKYRMKLELGTDSLGAPKVVQKPVAAHRSNKPKMSYDAVRKVWVAQATGTQPTMSSPKAVKKSRV
jgi:phage protein D